MTATSLTVLLGSKIAALLSRGNHTGTQPASTISDFTETVEDVVAAMLGRSSNVGITWVYTDNGTGLGTLAATVTGGGGLDAEAARDAVNAQFVGTAGVNIAVNDAADTVTFSISGVTASQISDATAAGRTLLTAADAAAQRAALNVPSKDEAGSYANPASTATPSPVGSSRANQLEITALAANAAFANPSGTPAAGNYLEIVVKDNGTARTITWGTAYKASDENALPTTTVVGKTHVWLFRFSSLSSKWVLIGVRTES